MRLLDSLDVIEAAPAGGDSRHALADHLQSVCADLDHPINEQTALFAVDHSVASERPSSHSSLLKDRPASQADLEKEVVAIHQKLKVKQAPMAIRYEEAFCLLHAVGLTAGLMPFIFIRGPWCLLGLPIFAGALWSLVRGIRTVWAHGPLIGNLKARLRGLRVVKVTNRPSIDEMKQWSVFPDLHAALKEIQTSDIPFLVQDVNALRATHALYQKQAQEAQQSVWAAQFQALVHAPGERLSAS